MNRLDREHVNGVLAGYKWLVTFNSDEGDIPLLSFDNTPTAGTDLLASESKTFLSGTLQIREVVKGQFITSVEDISGLTAGNEYSVSMFASNAIGDGAVTASASAQNDGEGMKPFTFNLYGEPSAPSIHHHRKNVINSSYPSEPATKVVQHW